MTKAVFKIGPYHAKLVKMEGPRELSIINKEHLAPMLLPYLRLADPVFNEEGVPIRYEMEFEEFERSGFRFYHAFRNDEYFSHYAAIVDLIIKSFQGDEIGFEYDTTPVTFDVSEFTSENPSMVLQFEQARMEFNDVLRGYLAYEKSTHDVVNWFNEKFEGLTDFKFTGNIVEDLEKTGGAEDLLLAVLGEFQGDEALIFRLTSTFKSSTKKAVFLFRRGLVKPF